MVSPRTVVLSLTMLRRRYPAVATTRPETTRPKMKTWILTTMIMSDGAAMDVGPALTLSALSVAASFRRPSVRGT